MKFDRKHFEQQPRLAGLVQSPEFQKWLPAAAPVRAAAPGS
jgi:hypothetical protein